VTHPSDHLRVFVFFPFFRPWFGWAFMCLVSPIRRPPLTFQWMPIFRLLFFPECSTLLPPTDACSAYPPALTILFFSIFRSCFPANFLPGIRAARVFPFARHLFDTSRQLFALRFFFWFSDPPPLEASLTGFGWPFQLLLPLYPARSAPPNPSPNSFPGDGYESATRRYTRFLPLLL